MKKRILGLSLMLLLMSWITLPVRADSYRGGSDWLVRFTADNEMVSNFKTSDLDESVSGLQPGDDIIFTVKLRNDNSTTTNWWMTNEVLESLENRSNNSDTHGGAYGYVLTYTDKSGGTSTLYDSDTVGGEGSNGDREGLRAATYALEKYFYLDTLATGESGTITLKVSLDGETQGNDYQDTLANLQMNFAVELNPDGTLSRSLIETVLDEDESELVRLSDIVRTNDETNLTPYLIAMAVSGVIILILAVGSMKKSKKDKRRAG